VYDPLHRQLRRTAPQVLKNTGLQIRHLKILIRVRNFDQVSVADTRGKSKIIVFFADETFDPSI
jgi:hypothetical protein